VPTSASAGIASAIAAFRVFDVGCARKISIPGIFAFLWSLAERFVRKVEELLQVREKTRRLGRSSHENRRQIH
jgi:hypothetical protein